MSDTPIFDSVADGVIIYDTPKGRRNSYEMVKEFHDKFGMPITEGASLQERSRRKLRLALIKEEFKELRVAVRNDDLVEIADALGDLEYVINGMAIEYGINLPAVVEEIHRSNMTKLQADGTVRYRSDGKVQKGENYERPNLSKVLFDS